MAGGEGDGTTPSAPAPGGGGEVAVSQEQSTSATLKLDELVEIIRRLKDRVNTIGAAFAPDDDLDQAPKSQSIATVAVVREALGKSGVKVDEIGTFLTPAVSAVTTLADGVTHVEEQSASNIRHN